MRLTDVVKNLLIINVLMFFGSMLLMGDPDPATSAALINEQTTNFGLWGRFRLALFLPGSPYFHPYQLVTHMFMHANLTHLFFNMFALYMFGPPIEMSFGSKRFLFYYLFAGFGAMFLQLGVTWLEIYQFGAPGYLANIPMVGASGAIFGLLAAFGYLFPNSQIMLIFPPIPMRAKYFVLLYAGAELMFGLNTMGGSSGVAHFAHVGGALFGFLLLLYWKKR